jgi:hypothetical protein
MPFPDERDRQLRREAEAAVNLARELGDWAAAFNPERRRTKLSPLAEEEEFELLDLRRRAEHLLSSACVPAAAAVFGPSQSGKSLLIGQILRPKESSYSPLGRDEALGEPAYFSGLSFTEDLNPRCGANEATALVTRFTTKDRMRGDVPLRTPVMVLTLSRSDWLRVLARGFQAECRWDPANRCSADAIEQLLRELAKDPSMVATKVDWNWRLDLTDAFDAMRQQDEQRFSARGAELGGLLARYPLSDQGYATLAARLFWEGWPGLTTLFHQVSRFIEDLAPEPGRTGEASRAGRPAILSHWAGVRFLLDSQRTPEHILPRSRHESFRHLIWSDFQLVRESGWAVLDHRPGHAGQPLDINLLQAALLEMVIPILPERIHDDWRQVLENIDLLDIPGMRAVREGAAQGRRVAANDRREQLEIVKRGKVLYLFDRYVDELQAQTLLLLVRGGNIEVRGQMSAAVERWGRARYGKHWGRVRDPHPAFLVGITGIDDEFRDQSYPTAALYDRRLEQLGDTFGPIMRNFDGAGQAFDNIFPIRYPGSWDSDALRRQGDDVAARWEQARQAFLSSPQVKRHVRDAARRWDTAMEDADGGLSLVARAFLDATSASGKQDQLQRELTTLTGRLGALAMGWIVNEDVAQERAHRGEVARKILDWLADPEECHVRIPILNRALTVQEGDVLPLADLEDLPAARAGEPKEKRLARSLGQFFDRWISEQVPDRWREAKGADTSLSDADFLRFSRHLASYLRSQRAMGELSQQLEKVVFLQLLNEDARRHARRRYTQMILNDFIFNPGPTIPVWTDPAPPSRWRFGLQEPFVRRWQQCLAVALSDGAGVATVVPPGNAELIRLAEDHGLLLR